MKKRSNDNWDAMRAKIMGLGETSVRKSYYPELQQRLAELQRFKTLLDQTNDIIFLVQVPDGKLADVSQSASRQLGYTRDELFAMALGDLTPPDTSAWIKKYFSCDKICSNHEEILTTVLYGRTGNSLPVEMTLRIVPFKDSVYAVAVARDITKRKQALEEVRRSEQKYRTLVESSSDSILLIDAKRIIVSCNHAFLDLFGYSREEVMGKSTRFLHPSYESYHSLFERASTSLQTEGSFRTDWELMNKDGSLIPIEETISAIKGPDGSVQGYVAIIRDVTQRKQAEEELKLHRDHLEEMVAKRTADLEEAHKALMQEEKLKTLGAISAEVAHEIRNPLVSVGGFARRLHRKYPESVEAKIILKECRRLEKILERIKNYLKPVEMQPGECSVNQIITDSVDLMSPELEGSMIDLKLNLDPQLPPAYVDPGILTEVIINMITKASKVMDKRRPIEIATNSDRQSIHIDFVSPVSSKVVSDPELLLLPFEDSDETMGMPVYIKLLKEMGGLLLFRQEQDAVVFNVSVPRAAPDARPVPLEIDHADQDRQVQSDRS